MDGAKINDSLSVSRHECGNAEYVNECHLYFHRSYPLNTNPNKQGHISVFILILLLYLKWFTKFTSILQSLIRDLCGAFDPLISVTLKMVTLPYQRSQNTFDEKSFKVLTQSYSTLDDATMCRTVRGILSVTVSDVCCLPLCTDVDRS